MLRRLHLFLCLEPNKASTTTIHISIRFDRKYNTHEILSRYTPVRFAIYIHTKRPIYLLLFLSMYSYIVVSSYRMYCRFRSGGIYVCISRTCQSHKRHQYDKIMIKIIKRNRKRNTNLPLDFDEIDRYWWFE